MVNQSPVGLGCGDNDPDCLKAQELVNNYIDGLLEDPDQGFIARHLDQCPGCKHGYEFESAFHVRVGSLKPECMPLEVKSQIMLALGFPGMSGSTPAQSNLMSNMGIPKGEIPKGSIPGSGFLSPQGDLPSETDS